MRFCRRMKDGLLIVVAVSVWIIPAEGQRQKATDFKPVKTQPPSRVDQGELISKQFAEVDTADHRGPSVSKTTSREPETRNVVAPGAKSAPNDSDWQFELTPYLYATGIRGPVEARGRRLDLDASFAKLFDSLDFTIAGSFEARKKRFVSLNDVIWYKLSNTRDTPGGLMGQRR